MSTEALAAYRNRGATVPAGSPTFYSVSQVARMFGMSAMTLYRAIEQGQFPAMRIRGRLIIPARAIDDMVDAAVSDGRQVDAADWVNQPEPVGSSLVSAHPATRGGGLR
jgi:excisionase family DNA binding protein